MNTYFKKKNELSPFDESSSLKDFFQMPFFKQDSVLKTDVVETTDSYTLIMDIPGYTKDDVKVLNEDGYLTIEVSQSNKHETINGNYLKKERMHGSYSRSYYIGASIESKDIHASYSNGVLQISFPKEKDKAPSSYIEIKDN